MFELLLNAATIALSKDARESASSLLELIRRSPDWEKAIGTVEARISSDVRERVQLVEDLIAEKLKGLSYRPESIAAFRTATTEFADNAFEHGVVNAKRAAIKIVIETSLTYVSTTVHNPKGSEFDLERGLASAAASRIESRHAARGRGLVLVCRRADVVQMAGSEAIKALVYRDAVDIKTLEIQSVVVAIGMAGHANPSLPRRIREYLDDNHGKKIVICLDAKQLRTNTDDAEDRGDGTPKTAIIRLVLSDIQQRNAADPNICLVGEPDLCDLLPEFDTAPSIDLAITKLLSR